MFSFQMVSQLVNLYPSDTKSVLLCSMLRYNPCPLVFLGRIVLPWRSTWHSPTITVLCSCPNVTWNPFLQVTERLERSCSLARKTTCCLTWHLAIFKITAVILNHWTDERQKPCPQCVCYLEKIKSSLKGKSQNNQQPRALSTSKKPSQQPNQKITAQPSKKQPPPKL